MPEKLFWRKMIRLMAFIAAFLFVTVVGVILLRNVIVSSLINYRGNVSGVSVECLDFDLKWNLNADILELCLNHPKVEVRLSDGTWNIWTNTLSINSLILTHLKTPNDPNQNVNTAEQPSSLPPLELPSEMPWLNIKQLVVTSDWLNKPLNIHLTQIAAARFKLLGDLRGEVSLQERKVLAEFSWKIVDLSEQFSALHQTISDYSTLLDSEAINQTPVITKIEFDGQNVSNSNHINFSNTLSLNNCQISLSVRGDILISTKVDEIPDEIDLSKLAVVAQLQQCQTLMQIPEFSNIQHLVLNIPHPLYLLKDKIIVQELSATIPDGTPSTLKLLNLNLRAETQSTSDYELSLNPAVSPNLKFHTISFRSAGKISFDSQHVQLHAEQNKIDIIDLQRQGYEVERLEATFELQFSSPDKISGRGKVHSSDLRLAHSKIANLTSTFDISGPNINDILIQFESELNDINFSTPPADPVLPEEQLKLSIKQLTSKGNLQLNALNNFTVGSETNLNHFNLAGFPISKVEIHHQLQGYITEKILTSSHLLDINGLLSATLEQQQDHFQLQVNEQKLANLRSLFKPLVPELKIGKGQFSASVLGSFDTSDLAGQFHLKDVFATFQDYQLNQINYQNSFAFNSAGLQLAASNITANSVNAGVSVDNISASLSVSDNKLKLEKVSGTIFGGSFSLEEMWLDGRSQSTYIELKDIELAKLVELQQQPGIHITGRVQGSLPLQSDNNEVSIDSGMLISQGPGKLRIVNNPAFDSIKFQQSELAFLENMDFTQLSSTVRFNPDGWLFLDFALIGDNTEKKQSVKFNYAHQQNILTLLKSLRLTNSVQNKIEKSLKEGGNR